MPTGAHAEGYVYMVYINCRGCWEESKSLINHDFRDKRHTIRFFSQLPFLILSVSLWRPGQTETTTVNPRHRFSGRRG